MSQDPVELFQNYADAFEVGFATRDWQVVGDLMAEDVTWTTELPPPMGGTHVGRDAVIAGVRKSTDGFDRRFDLRMPEITGAPAAFPGGVYLPWKVTYTRHGLPPFVLIGEEWDLFRDGKMVMHHERFHNARELGAFLQRHHNGLLPA